MLQATDSNATTCMNKADDVIQVVICELQYDYFLKYIWWLWCNAATYLARSANLPTGLYIFCILLANSDRISCILFERIVFVHDYLELHAWLI